MRRRALLTSILAALLAAMPAGAAPPRSGIVHVAPTQPLVEWGHELYAGNCSSCHGSRGEGVTPPTAGAGAQKGEGPRLQGVGALSADFYLRTGYMPLERAGVQPTRSRVLFSDREIRALVAYVASLGPGPPIPAPHPERGQLSTGFKLFTEHCAGCHQVSAEGGYVTGARVPPLNDATAVQIAEAVRIGPYLMPRFPKSQISDSQLDSIVAYVQKAKHPEDRGGWGIGHVGPVPEGIVAWLVAMVALVAACVVIGRRLER